MKHCTRNQFDLFEMNGGKNILKIYILFFGIFLMTETGVVYEQVIPSMEELLQKYDAMKSSNKIAEDYNVTGRTVRNWMEKYGISRRVSTPSREELSAKCETKTLAEIAEEYDVCLATVKSWRRNYGIEITKRLSGKSKEKISERRQERFGARKIGNEKPREDIEINYQNENNAIDGNEEKHGQTNRINLDTLIDFYNPLFDKDRNKVMKDIFKKAITKTGNERLTYMALHRHYKNLYGTSA